MKSKFAWRRGTTTRSTTKKMPKKHHPARANQMFYRMMLMIPKTPLPVCTVKFSTVSPVLSGLSVKYVSSGLARKANSSYSGVRTETKRPFQVATS